MINYPSISVVIPNYNGLKHLQDFLRDNLKALEHYKGKSQIIICDDHSTDGSLDYLQAIAAKEPLLEVCLNSKKGASSARNEAMKISQNEYILFIDNDFLLSEDFLNDLVKYITVDIFCIACCIYSYFDKSHQQDGAKLLDWKRGFLRFTRNIYNDKLNNISNIPSFGVQGACFLCSSEKARLLAGYDEILFEPYLLEESDFFYRGLKRGWRITYAPGVLGWHKIGGTIASKTNPFTKFLSKRNRFIFVWKNIHSTKLLLEHFLFLPLIIFKPSEIKAFFAAIKLLPEILKARKYEKEQSKVSDLELLKRSKDFENSLK